MTVRAPVSPVTSLVTAYPKYSSMPYLRSARASTSGRRGSWSRCARGAAAFVVGAMGVPEHSAPRHRMAAPPRRRRMTCSKLACLLTLSLPLLSACATVPGTDRHQLMMVPLALEMSLGGDGYQQTLTESQGKLITSGPDYDRVQRVGERIAAAAQRLYPDPANRFTWEIVLIDEPETVNAWCMPGGKMAVYTGLLPITQDENSLAVVVGHEVAHAVARHGGERMSQTLAAELAIAGA